MLMFCGFDIELTVEAVVAREDALSLCCARDWSAHQWLIVTIDRDPDHLAWLCVPVSERAMKAAVTGRTPIRDVIRHSCTGTVELVVVEHGHAVPDSCMLCSEIPEQLLPGDDREAQVAA